MRPVPWGRRRARERDLRRDLTSVGRAPKPDEVDNLSVAAERVDHSAGSADLVEGSDFAAAQFLEADEGVWDDNGVWKRTDIGRTAQGDYAPPTVTLPPPGPLFKVKLLRY